MEIDISEFEREFNKMIKFINLWIEIIVTRESKPVYKVIPIYETHNLNLKSLRKI